MRQKGFVFDLTNKAVVVIGASAGFGVHFARALHAPFSRLNYFILISSSLCSLPAKIEEITPTHKVKRPRG